MPDLSRRRVFQLGGVTALAASGLPIEASLMPALAAGVTRRFDLASAGHPLYVSGSSEYPVETGVTTIQQSFGFDEISNILFVNQKTEYNAAGDPSALGNLVISRFSGTSPTMVTSQMKVIRAGHGGALAVEHIATPTDDPVPYLWIEMGAGSDGRGTGVARLKYRQTTTATRPYLGADGPDYPNVAPTYTGWHLPRPYLDHRHQRLAIWYRSTSTFSFRVVVWDMDDVRTNDPSIINNLSMLQPILDRVIVGTGNSTTQPIQGLCIYGDFAYLLQGTDKYSVPKTQPPPDPELYACHIRSYDLTQPGGAVQQTTVTIWKNMARREPEGICVKTGTSSDGSGDKLVFGIVDGPTNEPKEYWLAYKSGFITA